MEVEMQYRQGDVFIETCIVPEDVKAVKRARDGRLILAAGEATGHHHAIADMDVEMYERDGVLYLNVPAGGATVRHEEHGPITLPGGGYSVRIQREYHPDEIRRVMD
jgi:hypothetical protein